ncbi:hypothetical protein FNF29_03811 [Cafeteria roenbergensis]|uniref:TUG ubiquitin-like domain-containing protein n=1 Tax=Cafeteria roenbergensis TaxID=33653 RepID=A0A5A8CJC2_CAFRO|nr:hypothetical protein FNF29_03811 [Cafeteria roenbergensis]|eukprot:KAA0152584.1 hypothetical protein FNF29_03811 [Cafeteria roenbergensis]
MSVVIFDPDSRERHRVAMSPGKTLAQALEELCEKTERSPAEYELRRGAKALDSSLPWRLLRLPNNSSLELVRTRKSGAAGASAPRGGTAKLAVSLPSGSRVIVEPSIDATLADVLRGLDALGHFPAGADLAGASCLVVRRSVPPEALATTSLRGMGVSAGEQLRIRVMLPPGAGAETSQPAVVLPERALAVREPFLVRAVDGVLVNPFDARRRRLRLSNALVAAAVVRFPAGKAVLYAAGFQDSVIGEGVQPPAPAEEPEFVVLTPQAANDSGTLLKVRAVLADTVSRDLLYTSSS